MKQSIKDLVYYLEALSYPLFYDDLYQLIILMKDKGYFEADLSTYYKGTLTKLNKYFPEA